MQQPTKITDCMQLLQQTRKSSQQNPFAHHERSVKVSDDVSWQDKIGSNQFDNYLSQDRQQVPKWLSNVNRDQG